MNINFLTLDFSDGFWMAILYLILPFYFKEGMPNFNIGSLLFFILIIF